MNPRELIIGAGATLLAVALGAGAYLGWRGLQRSPPAPVAATEPAPAAAAAPAAPVPPAAPTIAHPIESQPGLEAAQAPAPGGDALPAALETLLGRAAARRFVVVDDFVARFVATVDNLDREHAPARLWPVLPTPGRFEVESAGGGTRIAASNAARYEPFVRFVEAVDTPAALALYVRFYPRFQQAYAELGYPGRYFNDRLVAVIDVLLAAPSPAGPLAVRLVEVKGSVPSTRPWTRQEFADPALEALPAGQKLLLRLGPAQAARLKAKLAAFRRGLATGAPR